MGKGEMYMEKSGSVGCARCRKHRRWMPLEGNTTGADRRSRRGPWEELCPHPQDGTSSGVCTAGMERAGGTHPLQPWGASPAGSGHMGEQPGVSSGTRCAQPSQSAHPALLPSLPISVACPGAKLLLPAPALCSSSGGAAAGGSGRNCVVPRLRGWANILSWTLSPGHSHGAAELLQPPALVCAGIAAGDAPLGHKKTCLGPTQVSHRPDRQDGHRHRSQQR